MLAWLLVIYSWRARHNSNTIFSLAFIHVLPVRTYSLPFYRNFTFDLSEILVFRQPYNSAHISSKQATPIPFHDCANKTFNRKHSKMCTFSRDMYSCGIHAKTDYTRIARSCEVNRRAKWGFCAQQNGVNTKDNPTNDPCYYCPQDEVFFDYDKYYGRSSSGRPGASGGSAGSAGRPSGSSSRRSPPGGQGSSRPAAPVGRPGQYSSSSGRPGHSSSSSSRPGHSSTSGGRPRGR